METHDVARRWIGYVLVPALLVALCAASASAQVVTRVEPSHGTVGTPIVITGSGFGAKLPKVRFDSGEPGGKYKFVVTEHSDVELRGFLKQAAPAVFDVLVFPKGTGSKGEPAVASAAFTGVEPVIVDVQPMQASPGDVVTIHGEHFGTKKRIVRVGAKKAHVQSWTDTTITCKLPKKLVPGTYDLEVKNSVGAHVLSGGLVIVAGGGTAFHVSIDISSGLVTFPNKYSGWSVGGAPATNFVAYPSGWSVGGSAGTNFVAVPPGWSTGGGAPTNHVAYAPGWSVGGAAQTNWVALPPGWSAGGSAATNYVALPPGFTAGGSPLMNFTALPPGWSVGGAAATNYVAVPPGWTVGGSAGTNYVAYPAGQGWTIGGSSATNWTALPPGWSVGGGAATNYVAVPPGWSVGGGATNMYVTYPGPTVTSIQVKFDDPGWLAILQAIQDSGDYSEESLADIVMYAFLNLRARIHIDLWLVSFESPAGQW